MRASGDPHFHPHVVEELKAKAHEHGLWNLFLHVTEWTPDPVSNTDYTPLARSQWPQSTRPRGAQLGRCPTRKHGDPVAVRDA